MYYLQTLISINFDGNKIFQFCFRILKESRIGFHVADFHCLWKPNAKAVLHAKFVNSFFFLFQRVILNYEAIHKNVDVCRCFLWW